MKVVFTAGFFDPIHRGHIYHLKAARSLGDKLVVLVHRDECCIRKKGYFYMPLEDRRVILESLRFVDEVIVCPEDCNLTVERVLERLRPNIYARGGDRTAENMPQAEVEACERLNIEIVYGVGGGKVQSSSLITENFLKRRGLR
jgi:D-beta-D-heptose 7-phosphate kinase/D-beta-D-heptose 1-phosphate adenosyltransferase